MAASGYAVASCRMLILSFTSSEGCFQEALSLYGDTSAAPDNANTTTNNAPTQCQASIGLYQWLQPASSDDFKSGNCVGYEQTMLSILSDQSFEAARTFGVFSVLLSFVIFFWSLLLACIQLNRCQIWIFRCLCFFGTLSTGLTFLIQQSTICQSLFETESCKLDQGGLTMIAAFLFWFISFFIAQLWLSPDTFLNTPMFDVEDQFEQDKLKAQLAGTRARVRREAREARRQEQMGSVVQEQDAVAASVAGHSSTNRAAPTPNSRLSLPMFGRAKTPSNDRRHLSEPPLRSSQKVSARPSSTTGGTTRRGTTRRGGTARTGPRRSNSDSSLQASLSRERVTVDDVSRSDQLEVYFSPSGKSCPVNPPPKSSSSRPHHRTTKMDV